MKTIIMCAGCGKRYERSYPKQIEEIEGQPNYQRTITLLGEKGTSDVFISVSEENSSYFTHPYKIMGSNVREIDRFRNLREFINQDTLVLYGDVVYHERDIGKMISYPKTDVIFFGRCQPNFLTKKLHGEIMGVFVRNYKKFFNAVDAVALKFEQGIINREIAWDVHRELKAMPVVKLSKYSDDYDTIEEYLKIKEMYAHLSEL